MFNVKHAAVILLHIHLLIMGSSELIFRTYSIAPIMYRNISVFYEILFDRINKSIGR